MCWHRCRTPTAAPPINDRLIDRRSRQNLATSLERVRRHDVAVGHLDHRPGCGPYQPQPLLDRAHDLDHLIRAARGVPALARVDLGGDHVRTLPLPGVERVFAIQIRPIVPVRPDVHAPPAFDLWSKGRRAPRRCPVLGVYRGTSYPPARRQKPRGTNCRSRFGLRPLQPGNLATQPLLPGRQR